MNLEIAWLCVLGFLLTGCLVLCGADYGVQMLSVFTADDRDRRTVLNALAPFFFGNEVWLVATVGVLIGAFPVLERALFLTLYPLIVLLVLGVVVGKAAVQLRSRSATHRRLWDGCICAGGAVAGITWGLIGGVLLSGVPLGEHPSVTWSMVLNPFVLACGAATGALFAVHGAMFLRLRIHGEVGPATGAALRRLLGVAMLTVVVAILLGVASARMTNPITALVIACVPLVALAYAWWAQSARRDGHAFTATGLAVAALVPLIGFGNYPFLLVSGEGTGMTLSQSTADTVSLHILGIFVIVLIPIILAYQFWSWWAFRARVSRDTRPYF